jgi:nitrate/nitrite transporter NarK
VRTRSRRILWGWIADRTRDALGLLHKIALTVMGCCIGMAFVGPAWPTAFLALFLIVFGLAAVGWNGLFLAEIAHGSPHGMVSVVTSAALVWNFGDILIGPALFAATYAWSGSYAQTFGGLSAIAFLGVVALTLSRAARRRERRCSKN